MAAPRGWGALAPHVRRQRPARTPGYHGVTVAAALPKGQSFRGVSVELARRPRLGSPVAPTGRRVLYA
jgi:hypothetical protein